MAVGAPAGMTVASVVCGAVVLALLGDGRGVLLGLVGPLVAALATWVVVARTYACAPARVLGAMIVLFGVKVVSYPAYVVAVVLLLGAGSTAFVVSFTCQIVLLYGLEAFYLRRLFAGAR